MKNNLIFIIRIFFLLCTPLFLFNGCKEKEEKIILGSSKIIIDKNWQFRQAGKDEWYQAMVPGCVHTDLLNNDLIKDPFKKDNEKKLQWIEREDWEYKTNIYVPFGLLEFDKVELNFDGLDTYASIYLNDSLLLRTDNMFIGWKVPCKKYLKPGENNLRIYFHSAINKVMPKVDSFSYKLPAPFDNSKLKSSMFTRKAAYQYGWDFSPRFVSSGIWKPIVIEAWNTARLENINIIQQQIKNAKADLSAIFEIQSEKDIKAEIIVKSREKLFKNFTKKINLKKGKNNYQIDFQILKPKRWWANGIGEAFLYSIICELKINSQMADSLSIKTGLRTIEVENRKDSVGESFTIILNDKPIYIKGAAYIPADFFPSRTSKEKYKSIIRSAKEANINLLRVYGAGIYETDEFYNLCDENGILIWQDFMFANSMFSPDTLFRKSIEKEVEYNVKRLRGHPCIALWCGNENIENAWYNSLLQNNFQYLAQDSIKIWENYLKIFHVTIPNAVKRNDDRYYLHSSPKFPFPKNKNSGDFHFTDNYKNVINSDDYINNSGRFVSGFGFQSMPSINNFLLFGAREDYNMDGTIMKSHQKLIDGNKILKNYILKFHKAPNNFENLIYVSQILQADLLKKAIESQRRKKPYCMGSIFNYLNDSWPGINSSTINYDGDWKAANFIIKKAYAPILVSPVIEGEKLKVYIVSDRLVGLSGVLQVKIIDLKGKEIFNQQTPVQIPPNSNNVYFESVEWKKFMKGKNMKNLVLEAKLSENNEFFYRNLYYFSIPKELNLLSKTKINFTISGEKGNYYLNLNSSYFQSNVYLSSNIKEIKYSDNFFDLLPLEKYTINLKYNKKISKEALLKSLIIKSLRDTY